MRSPELGLRDLLPLAGVAALHDSQPILDRMALVEREQQPEQVSGVERSLEVKLGSLGGFELRPTRLFLWKGSERDEERLVAFGERPSGLDYERHETTTKAGSVELRTIGNPLMTIAMAGVIAFKRWTDPGEP
jgi:hypothetical protein